MMFEKTFDHYSELIDHLKEVSFRKVNFELTTDGKWKLQVVNFDSNPIQTNIKYTTNFRATPDYALDNIVGLLYLGDSVEYIGEEKGWAKIKFKSMEGYVGFSALTGKFV